jgi:chemotaxis protein methyltransferase CheR
MTALDRIKKSTAEPVLQPAGGGPRLPPQDFSFLRDYVYRESGIVLDQDKHYLVDARLTPIVQREGLKDLSDLCGLLRGVQGKRLGQQVVEAMTTNETLFFRDAAQYEALRNVVVNELVNRRGGGVRKLSFWSAAASSGQEAYSLVMLLFEMGLQNWNLQILGTDLNEVILARAREARYTQIEINRGLPVHYLMKYFHRVGLEWQVKDELRRMVHWQRFDLRQPMRGKGPFDVILCRNVLIYFDMDTKKKILAELRSALHPGGYLLLGGAETAICLDGLLRRVEIGSAVLYQAADA